jgi:hypothetical protein
MLACVRKRRYPDKKSATTAANLQLRIHNGRHHGAKDLRVYPCPFCRGWHMTSRMSEPTHTNAE